MIDSNTAIWIMGAMIVGTLIVVPFLDRIPYIGKSISLRYTVVSIYIVLATGVVIDFSHLDTSTRNLVIVGSLILSTVFLIFRSFEKSKVLQGVIRDKDFSIRVSKGDLEATVGITEKDKEKKDDHAE